MWTPLQKVAKSGFPRSCSGLSDFQYRNYGFCVDPMSYYVEKWSSPTPLPLNCSTKCAICFEIDLQCFCYVRICFPLFSFVLGSAKSRPIHHSKSLGENKHLSQIQKAHQFPNSIKDSFRASFHGPIHSN